MTDTCNLPGLGVPRSRFPDPEQDLPEPGERSRLVLAGGCFWCVEAVFMAVDGVLSVQSGYAGGAAETASYEAVCSGTTGHAEAVEVYYDPRRISLGQLLKIFFSVAHDPTQLDRQGNDIGSQYRSAVFFESREQRGVVQAYIHQLDAAKVYADPIVTRLEPLQGFYPAEACHQNFAARNPGQPYIMAVAAPKLNKLATAWPDQLKPEFGNSDPDLA